MKVIETEQGTLDLLNLPHFTDQHMSGIYDLHFMDLRPLNLQRYQQAAYPNMNQNNKINEKESFAQNICASRSMIPSNSNLSANILWLIAQMRTDRTRYLLASKQFCEGSYFYVI